MPRLPKYIVRATFLFLAGPATGDQVLWLPPFEPVHSGPAWGAPAWSPDGERFAFTFLQYIQPQYHSWEVDLLARDGTVHTCLLEWGSNGRAAWSPLGTRSR